MSRYRNPPVHLHFAGVNGEEKHNTDQQSWLRAQGLATFTLQSDHNLTLLKAETSPLAQGVLQPQMSLC